MALTPLETLCAVAEGNGLFVQVNLVNSPAQAIRCFIGNPDFCQATERLRSEGAASEEILARMRRLLADNADERTRHRWDVAVAAYLFALEQLGNSASLEEGLRAVRESGLRNLFWANAVHNYLAEHAVTASDASTGTVAATDASETVVVHQVGSAPPEAVHSGASWTLGTGEEGE